MDKNSFGIPNTEPGGILIALRFVLVVKHCDKRTSQNIPVSIICFYTLLLEVSQHGGGACRDFTAPLATSLSLSVPAQGVAFSYPGARRQRQRMHLFYDSLKGSAPLERS